MLSSVNGIQNESDPQFWKTIFGQTKECLNLTDGWIDITVFIEV
jgi:hypothetical protein